MKRKQISSQEARRIGDSLHIDWDQVDLEQFRQDLMGTQKQSSTTPDMDTAYDGVLLSGKTVLAHMQEFPDYFSRLQKLKAEAEEFQSKNK